MIVGWLVCSSMLLVLVFVHQEPPFYIDSQLRGKDLSDLSPAELRGRINWKAPSSGSLYIVVMMLASLGYMIADVASDGLVVEFAQREPENSRGNIQSTVYLVRSIAMILAALLVGFGLNSNDYGGSFTWSFTMSQLMLILSLLSLLAIPAALWLVQEPSLGDHVPRFSDYMRSLWLLIQNSAMVQILAYRFFSGIFDGFTVTAGDPIQRYWAKVRPLNESLFSVLGLVVFSAALYVTKRIGLGWSWRRVIIWTTVSVIVLDAIVGMLTIWNVVRSQWFWLGTPILEELPQAMNFLVSTFVVVELAEIGNEAAVYGLLTTVSNLSSPFSSCISKNVNALFDVTVTDIIQDTAHVRQQVTWTFVIAYIMKLLSLAWLPLLPRQKRETQALKQRARPWLWGGVASISVFTFALVWSVTTNLLSIFSSTACLVIAGGTGCK
uniref:RxLR effector candidate protein n=1 Tax=Hyaloperonospora arabidopsidis (strain Emoy2) TaxID=559515 RepID=M4BK74_HYAAE